MSYNGWDLDTNGNIAVCPLTGYAMALAAGMGCLLRVEFARSPDQLGKSSEAIQLAMGPAQAREIAEALLRMVAKVDTSTPQGTTRN